jgi:hypothetical protein
MPGKSPQSDSSRRAMLLASIADQLACPACHADLRMDAAALHCTACGRVYPILEGIPVLIAEETDRE